MQTSKRHSRPALFIRCDGALQIAKSLTKFTLSILRGSTRGARQCRGTTEEKLRRDQRSPCLISPREIYERGSTTGFFFFFRLFPRCVFCVLLTALRPHFLSFLCGKNPVNRACSFDPAVHRDAQWRSANRPFQLGAVSRRMDPAAIFIIALQS